MIDYALEDTIFLPFTTRAFATGIPTVLSGTPAIDIYEDADTTPLVTGETLVVSLNSVVGFNMITVTATAGTGFNLGGHYTAIIQAGTVDSVSAVGEVVAEFTIGASAAAADLSNGTDGLGAIKTDTAAILVDTAEIGAAAGASISADIAAVKVDTAAILVDTADMQPKIGTPAADLSADIAAVKVDTAAVLVDTADMQPKLGTPAADVSADIAAVKVDTAATLVDTVDIQGRLPAALSSGNMKSDVLAISTSTEAANNLEASAETIVIGAAETGTLSTTVMTSNVTEATDDHFNGRIIIWTSGVLQDQATDITDYSGTNGTFTYTAVTEAPSNGDTFIVV